MEWVASDLARSTENVPRTGKESHVGQEIIWINHDPETKGQQMLNQLSSKTLRRAADIKDELAGLWMEFYLATSPGPGINHETTLVPFQRPAKRRFGKVHRAKLAAAQRKRWAKRKKGEK